MAVEQLRFGTFNAEDSGSTPALGTKILQAVPHGQKTTRKQTNNKQTKKQNFWG